MTARRVVLDVAAAPEPTYIGRHEVDEEEFIGETDKNVYGYSVAVKSVRLDRSGMRIRIECMRDGAVKHYMDLTSELIAYALPLLRQAAERGGPVEALRDGEWWTTCGMSELRRRAAEMCLPDVESLLGNLNAASSLATQAVELSGRAAQDLARAAVVQAKRKAVRNIAASMRDTRIRHKDGARLFLKSVGVVLRERLGEEVTESIFVEAKSRIVKEPQT